MGRLGGQLMGRQSHRLGLVWKWKEPTGHLSASAEWTCELPAGHGAEEGSPELPGLGGLGGHWGLPGSQRREQSEVRQWACSDVLSLRCLGSSVMASSLAMA